MVPQQPVDRPASESGSALAAHVPPPTSPPLEEGRRVSSQPATTPVPEPELTVEVGDRPATGLMEETVIYSVDDYYTRCASGCVVECRICNREVAGSNLGLGYFAPRSTQTSIPPRSVNEYQL